VEEVSEAAGAEDFPAVVVEEDVAVEGK